MKPKNAAESLADNFQASLDIFDQQRVVDLYREDYGIKAESDEEYSAQDIQDDIDRRMMSRFNEIGLCSVTISIPYCSLCKQPEIVYTEDAEHHEFFPHVEWEPNEVLWKWLSTQDFSGVFETTIKTAFIRKPCMACIDKETALRRQVSNFLMKHHGKNYLGWLVCNWVFSRGIGNFPMFDHAALNHTYPDGEAPTIYEILEMMAASWKRITHVAWESIIDLKPPVSYAVPTMAHAEPLINFDQWPEIRPDAPLTLGHTLSSMDVDDSGSSDDGEDMGVFFTKAPKPRTWGKTLHNLVCLGENKPVMESMQRESGLSQSDFDKAYSALKNALAQASKPPPRGSIVLAPTPAHNRVSSFQEQDSTSQDPKDRGQEQARGQERSLSFSVVKVKPRTRHQGVVEEGEVTARADTPSSMPGRTRSPTPEADSLPMTPDRVDSRGTGKEVARPVKRVRFADLDSVQIPDDDLFGDTLSVIDESESSNTDADGDIEMAESGSETLLSDDEGEIQKCNMGAWHLACGRAEDATSELIYLPLGVSYAR